MLSVCAMRILCRFFASYDVQVSLDKAGPPEAAQADTSAARRWPATMGSWSTTRCFASWPSGPLIPRLSKPGSGEFLSRETVPMALNHVLLDKLENKEAARAAIRQAFDDPANHDATRMTILLLYADRFGDRDLALAALRRGVLDLKFEPAHLWHAYVTNLRTDSRFKDLVKYSGLVDYWRTTGNWGDFWTPVGKDDFECH